MTTLLKFVFAKSDDKDVIWKVKSKELFTFSPKGFAESLVYTAVMLNESSLEYRI